MTTINEVMADVRKVLTNQSNKIASWGYQESTSVDNKRLDGGEALLKVETLLDEARHILFDLEGL